MTRFWPKALSQGEARVRVNPLKPHSNHWIEECLCSQITDSERPLLLPCSPYP